MAAGVDRLLDFIEFELTTTANGQGFGTKFIVGGIVPEPSTGLLLAFGLVVLARRRKRAQARQATERVNGAGFNRVA